MATTTTNFGWPVPQSTDLVKDGATAISNLGSGVDTSMAQLKGGTTGQILSKTSGTDMAFTWVTPNPGDITGVTAGTGLTGGGTSGDVTLSFDVATYGGAQKAAGKNVIINGAFDWWQRGTSTTTNDSYLADRFKHYWDGSGTFTVNQQTFTPGTAPIAGYEGAYFQRKTCNTVGTSTFIQSSQYIEDVRTYAGQTATFSFFAKASAASTFSIIAYQNFGSGGSTAVLVNNTTQAITTSWARYSVTIAIPSISGKTIGTGSNLQFILRSGTPTASATFDDWGWQLEAGSTASGFQTATGTKQGELAACQRYYYRTVVGGTNSAFSASGVGQSTTATVFTIPLPTPMRTTPTLGTDYSTLAAADFNNTPVALTGLTINTGNSNPQIAVVNGTSASGITQYRPYFLCSNSSANGYVGVSAEL